MFIMPLKISIAYHDLSYTSFTVKTTNLPIDFIACNFFLLNSALDHFFLVLQRPFFVKVLMINGDFLYQALLWHLVGLANFFMLRINRATYQKSIKNCYSEGDLPP